MVSEKEPYLSKETEVYNLFIKEIDYYLQQGYTVYADATHINKKSRNKLINNLSIIPNNIVGFFFDIPFDIIIERNNQRQGRLKVPIQIIKQMYNSIEKPDLNEVDELYIIDKNGSKIKEF